MLNGRSPTFRSGSCLNSSLLRENKGCCLDAPTLRRASEAIPFPLLLWGQRHETWLGDQVPAPALLQPDKRLCLNGEYGEPPAEEPPPHPLTCSSTNEELKIQNTIDFSRWDAARVNRGSPVVKPGFLRAQRAQVSVRTTPGDAFTRVHGRGRLAQAVGGMHGRRQLPATAGHGAGTSPRSHTSLTQPPPLFLHGPDLPSRRKAQT